MALISFTSGDVARIRLQSEPLATVETLLALDLFNQPGRGGNAFTPWRRQVRQRLDSSVLTPLSTTRLSLRELYRLMLGSDYAPGGAGPPARRQSDEIRSAVRAFSAVAVAPYRRRVAHCLRADRQARAHVLLAGGIEELFTTLHPRIMWTSPVLEVPCELSRRVHLDGRGLRLVPSLFLGDRPAVLIETGHREDSPVLVYQALTDPDTIGALWHGDEPDPHALGALVGRTRAAALQVLRASCSTSELGNRLGVSTAAASQHATVLRNAGLITTRRRRNAVFHSLTPLGVALVDLGARPCDQVKAAWAFGD